MNAVGRTSGRPRTARTLLLLALLTAAAPLSVDIYTPSLPLIQRELGGADWLAQATITACLLGIGVGQLVWGPLSDRAGRRPVILAGVAGWTLSSLLSAAAPTPELLIAARALAGLCGGAGIVVARSVVRDLSRDPHAVSSRIGLLSMVTAVAPVVAPGIGAVIASAWGWRADFLALALLGAALGGAFAVFVPESHPPWARSAGGLGIVRALAAAVRIRELTFIALALAAQSFGFYAYIATASFVVERQFGHPPAVFALVFATNAAAMFGANIVFRRMVRRRHPALPLGIGLGVGTASGFAIALLDVGGGAGWMLWIASTIFAASAGFVLPGAHSWGQDTAAASGAASAVTGSAQFLGGVLGSPVTGVLGPTAAHLGLVIAAGSALGLILWSAARRHA